MVGNQKGRNFDVTMFYKSHDLSLHGGARWNIQIHTFEAPLKHMTRTRPVAKRVRHFEISVQREFTRE